MRNDDCFAEFLNAESLEERLLYLSRCNWSSESKIADDNCGWDLLHLLPHPKEKSRFCAGVSLGDLPDSQWEFICQCLRDSDHDVVGTAINCINHSGIRSLSHKFLHFFTSPEKPQRILYCLARYAEETIDYRLAPYLSGHLQEDLSDAFLARSFNALLTLGKKDTRAIHLAIDLVKSHIHATNMDRKAAVAAVMYLGFAGNQEHINDLSTIQPKIQIPELRRLLDWCLKNAKIYGKYEKKDAKLFFERNLLQQHFDFTGYGCFDENALESAWLEIKKTIRENDTMVSFSNVTLSLGLERLTSLLMKEKNLSLIKVAQQESSQIASLWLKYSPTYNEAFIECVNNPDFFDFFNSISKDYLLQCMNFSAFNKNENKWKEKIKTLKEKSDYKSIHKIISASCLSEQRDKKNSLAQGSQNIQINTTETGFHLNMNTSKIPVYLSIVSQSSEGFTQPQTVANSFEDKQQLILLSNMLIDELNEIFSKVSTIEENVFNKRIRSIYLALFNISYQFEKSCFSISKISALEDQTNKISTVFKSLKSGKNKETIADSMPDEEDESDSSSQNIETTGTIEKWEIYLRILQALIGKEQFSEKITDIEKSVIYAAKSLPHVEKRWAICALAKINSDESIRSLLYYGFSHLDTEFVNLSVKELLKSNHPRAQQALLRCIGKSSISDEIKLNILDDLVINDSKEIFQELRNLESLKLAPHIDEAIKDLIGKFGVSPLPNIAKTENISEKNSIDVDLIIRRFLPKYNLVSLDVRSTLRTAEMIYIQSKSWGEEAIDLSPIVNMYAKAVELMLREKFEAHTDALLRKGNLSRKLDLLGYARPIPEKMQLFEDYLNSLPIVKSISFFSKFKLRKMLRAICLYRPGKRFTLDGPKAFALLFLVIGRSNCNYGVEKMLDLGFKDDNELYEFVKLIHSLQDSRNRAAHEGLSWEAQDDIEAMRSQAYKIIATCIDSSQYLLSRKVLQDSHKIGA